MSKPLRIDADAEAELRAAAKQVLMKLLKKQGGKIRPWRECLGRSPELKFPRGR